MEENNYLEDVIELQDILKQMSWFKLPYCTV